MSENPSPLWLDLWKAAYSREQHRTAQAATVSPNGLPEVRTVVLRGMTPDGEAYFSCDARSAKVTALRANSSLSLLLWWPERQEQFRLRGRAHLVGEGESAASKWTRKRVELWRAQRASDRRSFFGPAPGTPLTTTAPPRASDSAAPPTSYLLVWLEPDSLDYLRLGPPHERLLFERKQESWTKAKLVP